MGRLRGISWGTARRAGKWTACVAAVAVVVPLASRPVSKPLKVYDTVPHLLTAGGSGRDTGSTTLATTTAVTGARNMWAAGYTGGGVDVAIIDSGIAAVGGLDAGKVIEGPDFTGGAGTDGFGHGTHLAGIISAKATDLLGMAPDA